MKKLVLFLLFVMVIAHGSWAAADGTFDCFGPDQCKFNLDEKAFKANIVERVNAGLKSRGKTDENISVDNIQILQVFPFASGSFKLVAVKFRLAPAHENQKGGISFLVVDPSGKYDIRELTMLSNGEDLRYDAMAIIRHEDLPEEFGYKILEGTGHSRVVMISDPMCYHCKSAFRYMLANTRNISKLEMLHYFRPGHWESETASRLILYAIKHDITPLEVIKFAYLDLNPPKTTGTDEEMVLQIQTTILNDFYQKFPKLKELLGNDTKKAMDVLVKETQKEADEILKKVEPLGITGTPMVFVDGMRIDGFKPDMLNRAFNDAQKNKNEKEVQGG